MIIRYDSVEFYVSDSGPAQSGISLILLHGFSGSGEVFDPVVKSLTDFGVRCIKVDLIGHGNSYKSTERSHYSMSFLIEALDHIILSLSLNKPWLLGYSLGSRVALNYASKFSSRLYGLVLESASQGIENPDERTERYSNDQLLAHKIRTDYNSFLIRWNRLPLFRSPDEADAANYTRFLDIQRSQNPECMALCMECLSPGLVPYISDQELNSFQIPIESITGVLDTKYTDLWQRKTAVIHTLVHTIIDRAGHRIHMDHPTGYSEVVKRILSKYQQT